MSLLQKKCGATREDASEELGIVSDESIAQIAEAIIYENCSPTEIQQIITECAAESVQVVTERSIVRLDKNAKKKHAYKVAILQLAKEDNNKLYKKLLRLWKIENVILRKLEKKYASKAQARAKEAVRRLSAAKSPALKKVSIAAQAKSKFMPTKKK